MKISFDGIEPPFFTFGVATVRDDMDRQMHDKIKHWAPKKAKSYSVDNIRHYDCTGMVVKEPTGNAKAQAVYFTTQDEGEFQL